MLTYVFWFGIINKSSRETHKTTTTEYVMERYRSGHNEAVLKTVCPQGRVGSNPTPCAFFCLKTDMQKRTKKFLTNEKHFDRINKLSQDRELKTKFKKIKKCLTNEQRFDKIIKLSQESKTKNIDN